MMPEISGHWQSHRMFTHFISQEAVAKQSVFHEKQQLLMTLLKFVPDKASCKYD